MREQLSTRANDPFELAESQGGFRRHVPALIARRRLIANGRANRHRPQRRFGASTVSEHAHEQFAYPVALATSVFCAFGLFAWQVHAEVNRVRFPNLDELVQYTTVRRGNVTEHVVTTPEALDAVKNGRSIPAGTHFVLVDHRDNERYRYFVMEKGEGFGADYDENRRTGDWQFQ
jgi:hypothetical protein